MLLYSAACSVAVAQPATPLPSPLTLGQALALADEPHPDLEMARSNIDRARARVLEQASRQGTRAYLDIIPEQVNSSTGGGTSNDSRARVLVTRQLTDFGRTHALENAARGELAARELAFLDARQRRHIDIMARFFDVLLADARYAVDNEDMAQRYVTYDRTRQRHTLGQVSEIAMLEQENRYQEALVTRTESQKRQYAMRLQLALALNRPDDIPGELVAPVLIGLERDIPDHKVLFETARQANPLVMALRRDAEAARIALQAERARSRPTLSAEIEVADYARNLQARSNFRAGLSLRIPLYQGGEVDAAVMRAASEQSARAAQLHKAEYDLQKTVLDAVQELETLKIKRQAAKQRVAFRDLYLDRARAIYEMEVQTSLGDAMTRLTEAQWLATQADFDFSLAWARVEALTGILIDTNAHETKP